MAETIYSVQGMTCAGCAAVVERAVAALAGVRHVNVNLDDKIVKVEYDEAQTDRDVIQIRMEDAGYTAKPI